MVPKNLTEERRTLGALLRAPMDALVREVYARLAEEGFEHVRPAHGAVFRHVLPQGSRTTELAAQAGMTKQSMGYLVDDLVSLGYAEVRPDPDDGRAKLVVLTRRGVEAQEAAVRFSAELEAEWARGVGMEEWAATRRTLERLADMLDP